MKDYTVDLFENTGSNVTGETEQHSFSTRKEAEEYCRTHEIPSGWRFAIGEWEDGKLIDMNDWEE